MLGLGVDYLTTESLFTATYEPITTQAATTVEGSEISVKNCYQLIKHPVINQIK